MSSSDPSKAKVRPRPKPKPKPKPKPLAQPTVDAPARSESSSQSRPSRRGRGGPRGGPRRGGRGRGGGSRSSDPSLANLMPSLMPTVKTEAVLEAVSEHHKSEKHDMEVDKSEDEIEQENDGDMLEDEEEEDEEEEENDKEKQGKNAKGRRKWSEIAGQWRFHEDPLGPIKIPFVPKNFERVDSTGVLRHFLHGDEMTWASLEADESDARHCICFQMPCQLPVSERTVNEPIELGEESAIKIKVEQSEPEGANGAQSGAGGKRNAPGGAQELNVEDFVKHLPNPFEKVKSGKVGKLKIHRSGKAYLYIGETKLEVSPGFNISCVEEYCHINPDEGKFSKVAGVVGHVVCSPDVESLLASQN